MLSLHRSRLSTVVALCLAFSAGARAQAGQVTAERLQPGTDRESIFDSESGSVHQHLDYDVALWGGYALNSLSAHGDEAPIVGHRVGANLVAQLSLFDWVALGLDLPLTVFQAGSALGADPAPATFGVGDVRIVPKIRFLRADKAGLDVALIPSVTLPTAFPFDGYLGAGGLTFAPKVAMSRQLDALRLAGNVGVLLRDERSVLATSIGSQVTYSAGVGYGFRELLGLPLGVDAGVSGAFQILPDSARPYRNPLEALVGASWDVFDGLQAFAGAGASIVEARTGPDLRVFGGVRWAPRAPWDRDLDGIVDDKDACPDAAEDADGHMDADGCADPDNDADGIADANDGCVDTAEDKDGFQDEDGCADADNDGDGVADDKDGCANDAEDKDAFQDEDGCPDPDNDGDGVLDAADKCQDKVEDKDGFQDDDGCPELDNDGDGFPDATDKCPAAAEVINGTDDEDGCPDAGASKVSVTADRIEILDKVFFDTGKATIQERSFDLLKQVAAVLKAQEQITKVEVQGHTDDVGDAAANKDLSQRRADAVREFLVAQGVAAERLAAVGYGEEKPVADNATAAGKDANRRVEFKILSQRAP